MKLTEQNKERLHQLNITHTHPVELYCLVSQTPATITEPHCLNQPCIALWMWSDCWEMCINLSFYSLTGKKQTRLCHLPDKTYFWRTYRTWGAFAQGATEHQTNVCRAYNILPNATMWSLGNVYLSFISFTDHQPETRLYARGIVWKARGAHLSTFTTSSQML